jgi:hypothetical protein
MNTQRRRNLCANIMQECEDFERVTRELLQAPIRIAANTTKHRNDTRELDEATSQPAMLALHNEVSLAVSWDDPWQRDNHLWRENYRRETGRG